MKPLKNKIFDTLKTFFESRYFRKKQTFLFGIHNSTINDEVEDRTRSKKAKFKCLPITKVVHCTNHTGHQMTDIALKSLVSVADDHIKLFRIRFLSILRNLMNSGLNGLSQIHVKKGQDNFSSKIIYLVLKVSSFSTECHTLIKMVENGQI